MARVKLWFVYDSVESLHSDLYASIGRALGGRGCGRRTLALGIPHQHPSRSATRPEKIGTTEVECTELQAPPDQDPEQRQLRLSRLATL
jgi:hypothetical protein